MATALYLSGPISGYPDLNFPLFIRTATKLRALGYTVFNPAEMGEHDNWTHADYMRRDIAYMLDADGMAVLEYAELSKGCATELAVAHAIGLTVLPATWWLQGYIQVTGTGKGYSRTEFAA